MILHLDYRVSYSQLIAPRSIALANCQFRTETTVDRFHTSFTAYLTTPLHPYSQITHLSHYNLADKLAFYASQFCYGCSCSCTGVQCAWTALEMFKKRVFPTDHNQPAEIYRESQEPLRLASSLYNVSVSRLTIYTTFLTSTTTNSEPEINTPA